MLLIRARQSGSHIPGGLGMLGPLYGRSGARHTMTNCDGIEFYLHIILFLRIRLFFLKDFSRGEIYMRRVFLVGVSVRENYYYS